MDRIVLNQGQLIVYGAFVFLEDDELHLGHPVLHRKLDVFLSLTSIFDAGAGQGFVVGHQLVALFFILSQTHPNPGRILFHQVGPLKAVIHLNFNGNQAEFGRVGSRQY